MGRPKRGMGAAIHSLIRRYIPDSDRHLSDQRLAELFCRDLPWLASWAAQRHLAKCHCCRDRRQELEGPRAQAMLRFCRKSIGSESGLSGERFRAQFVQRLDLTWRHAELRHARRRAAAGRPPGESSFAWLTRPFSVHPAATGAVTLSLVVAVSGLLFWRSQRSEPVLTADTLLLGAEKWDRPRAASDMGAVGQTIRIETPKETAERSVYRDRQGRRKAARPALHPDVWLSAATSEAGVNRDRPLSASAYQDWREHQPRRSDRVSRSPHLLTLPTTVAGEAVSAESLTVRDTDLQPVALLENHRDRLGAATRQERLLLGLLSGESFASGASSAPEAGKVREVAARNLALVRELIETNTPAARDVDRIFAEMAGTLRDSAIAAHRRTGNPQQQTARGGTE